ncbi:hypothetical protein D3C76_1380190 [compost metagenome]
MLEGEELLHFVNIVDGDSGIVPRFFQSVKEIGFPKVSPVKGQRIGQLPRQIEQMLPGQLGCIQRLLVLRRLDNGEIAFRLTQIGRNL